ncbi:MAG: hypothetical protein M3N59_02440 [bacterium]|nr:hypothetical protein [bacterium]
MPHRTVFQWGSNHTHPFTMFIGGVVVGALVTGAVAYAWFVVDEVDEIEVENAVEVEASPEATATATVEPTASPAVQF